MSDAKNIVQEAEELCENATPGPWTFTHTGPDERPGTADVCDLVNDAWVVTPNDLANYEDDGAFIARARTLVPDLVAEVKRLRAELETQVAAQPSPFVIADVHALDLALAFLDEILRDAGQPGVDRATLPSLGAEGWATAWLSQCTLASFAAARVRHPEEQRRIYVAAMELQRVLFKIFDRTLPTPVEPVSPSPRKKGGRHAAT